MGFDISVERRKLLASGMTAKEVMALPEHELRRLYYKAMEDPPRVIDPNAFDSYKQRFEADSKQDGFEETFLRWTCGQACGCMGPRDGDPYCPCRMRSETAKMYGQVVRK